MINPSLTLSRLSRGSGGSAINGGAINPLGAATVEHKLETQYLTWGSASKHRLPDVPYLFMVVSEGNLAFVFSRVQQATIPLLSKSRAGKSYSSYLT